MEENLLKEIEKEISSYPVFEYAFLSSSDVPFSEKVRYICRTECPMYNKSWSCPPAVGTVSECMERCRSFSDVFVFTTVADVYDITDMRYTLPSRMEHRKVVRQIIPVFERRFGDVLALSGEACAICEKCAWPSEGCRHPEEMLACIESHGIVVPTLAENQNMTLMLPGNTVVWFGMIFFNV